MGKLQMGDLEAGHHVWLFEQCIWLSLVGYELGARQKQGSWQSQSSPHHSGPIAAEIVVWLFELIADEVVGQCSTIIQMVLPYLVSQTLEGIFSEIDF